MTLSESYEVLVLQVNDDGASQSRFEFVVLCDAMEFASTCIECGDDGTEVRIKRVERD